MSGPDYGSSAFSAWRSQAGETWQAYTRHPFVTGLGDGTLPRAAFIHYLIQDYVFLIHYSRCWALAVVKAGSLDEMKLAASVVDGLINHEMRLHVEVCAREGIAEQQLFDAKEEIENLAYTRYTMDAGHSGDYLDMMAALAPCVFGYGEIGLELKAGGASDNPYQEWIDTYADPEYQALCDSVGALIDSAVASRLGSDPQSNPRWATLCERFEMATRLEVGFWSMGMRGAP